MKRIQNLFQLVFNDKSQNFIQAFAFSLLLSIAPLLIVFVVLFRYLALDIETLINVIQIYLPMNEVLAFIRYIENTNPSELISLIVLLITSLYLSSKSVYSFLRFTSDLEDVDYPNWYLRILAIWGQTMFILLLSALIFMLSFMGWNNVRWVPIILIIGFSLYFRNLSFRYRRFIYQIPGALVTTGLLMLMGLFFVSYVKNFTQYESMYGPLSSLMIVLLGILLIANIIFLGFGINHVFWNGRIQTVEIKSFERWNKLRSSFLKQFNLHNSKEE